MTPIHCWGGGSVNCYNIEHHSNQTRERKDNPSGREEVKLSLYSDGMILYIETPNNSIKLLALINEFSRIQE